MNFMSKDDLTEKLNSLGSAISEQAKVFNLYPIFKTATASSPDPTPGYIYDVLVDFTYGSKKNSEMLGDYLNKRLQRHSAHGVLKTLKCISQLISKGSRNFRIYMRQHDEHIKNAPNFGCQKNAFFGTAVLDDINKLVGTIGTDLFLQSSIERDSSTEAEMKPDVGSGGSRLLLSGMGNSTRPTDAARKNKKPSRYEGFGNSPIDRSGVTDSIREVVEQIIYAPDPKQELLESCLRSSAGKYKAARMGIEMEETGASVLKSSQPTKQIRKHIPGRAGGGWDDEDVGSDEDGSVESEDEIVEFGVGVCLTSSGGTSNSAGSVKLEFEDEEEHHRIGLITGTQEFAKIAHFCRETDDNGDRSKGIDTNRRQSLPPSLVCLDTLNNLLSELAGSAMPLNILYSLRHLFDTESGCDRLLFRLLVLTEYLLLTTPQPPFIDQKLPPTGGLTPGIGQFLPSAGVVANVIGGCLEARHSHDCTSIAIKSAKLSAIIRFLQDFKPQNK